MKKVFDQTVRDLYVISVLSVRPFEVFSFASSSIYLFLSFSLQEAGGE